MNKGILAVIDFFLTIFCDIYISTVFVAASVRFFALCVNVASKAFFPSVSSSSLPACYSS